MDLKASALLIGTLALSVHTSAAQDTARAVALGQANQEQSAEAIGHYARARALIVAAINEFDKGRRIARPDDLVEPAKWRNTLIDRAEDIERLLDPQPHVTKGGIKYSADPRLLPEARK